MRVIFHIDMDAFFASVEQRDNPKYAGQPVIIGADPRGGRGRGVVSTASYEARVFGIRSAMPISRAYELCPHGIYIRPRMTRYSEISEDVFEIFRQYTPLVEEIGIDEAFLDCTGSQKLFGSPVEIAKKIRKQVFEEQLLTCSVGIAPNKSVAKIASDLNKPDGISICESGREKEFLAPLPVGKLWGAGKKTVERLESIGIRKIGDLAAIDYKVAESILGKSGVHLWLMARGIDDRPVIAESAERKSISEEHTFEHDTDDEKIICDTILVMCDSVTERLRQSDLIARTVTVKIRLQGFETCTRRETLDEPFSDMLTLKKYSIATYKGFERNGKKIRLIGVGVSGLSSSIISEHQGSLFASEDNKTQKSEMVLDALREKFGNKILRGSLVKKEIDEE